MKNFLIRNIQNKTDFWSNTDGWVEGDATVFSEDERNTLNLPVDGEWVATEEGKNPIFHDPILGTMLAATFAGFCLVLLAFLAYDHFTGE